MEPAQEDPELSRALAILVVFMAKHISDAMKKGEPTVAFRLHYVPGYTVWWYGDDGQYIICEEW